jgi:predicted N-acetyltransferase YhbS
MKRLFVQPAFQGKGIGRALAQAIIEEGRRIGYKRMRLDTVLEPAKRLYRALGFREIPPYQHVPVAGVSFMEVRSERRVLRTGNYGWCISRNITGWEMTIW